MKKTLLAAALLFAAAGSRPALADVTSTFFTSGGTSIQVDVAASTTPGVHPSVIFLYGADGMSAFPWNYPSIATWFALQGYNFYVVHYFDKTATALATPLLTYK